MADSFAHVRMLLIDNYDSFTYNLVQAFAAHGADVIVHRNDAISVDQALELEPSHLVISPGPGRPEDAGESLAIELAVFAKRIEQLVPILHGRPLQGPATQRVSPRFRRAVNR